jgi:type IV pilus assembly protein PilF
MRIGLAAAAVLIAAGCAGGGARAPGEGPSIDTGTIVGEVGDPRNRAKLHTELAALYYSRGNMGIALEELRTAIAADDRYATAHGMLGVVYQGLRENSLAEESFARALQLSPNDSDINHNFGWYLCQNQRAEDSIKYFLHAIRNPLYPTPWRSYSAAGQCSIRLNNFKQAEQFFDRALRLDPDDPPSVLQMGQIRYRQGRMAEARRLVTHYNKLASPTAESLWLALRVERKLGQRVAETRFATQLRRRFPGSHEYQALQRGDFE